jgi:anti-anti-sigma factor
MGQDGNIASVDEVHGVTVVTLNRRMSVFNAPFLMRRFNRLLQEGARHFVVDLTDVKSVDTDGDYPLLHLLKCAQEVGGSVSLVCPIGNPIRVAYEMMQLDTLFVMAETLERAMAKLQPSPE